MFSNYLKVALRNLLNHKIYSAINIVGFAVGLAATILIFLYIRFQTSFDDFQANRENIYRAAFVTKEKDRMGGKSPAFTPPFGPAAAAEIADVRSYVRLSTSRVAYAEIDGESFKLTDIHHADSSFFRFFSFSLLRGNAEQALKNPYSLVLSQSTAARLFGTRDPIGAMIRLDGSGPFQVTGIVADPPANSSIQYSALISFSTLYENKNLYLDWNGGNQYIAYLELAPTANVSNVEKECRELLWRYLNKDLARIGVEVIPSLQPMKDIHFYHEPESDHLRNNVTIFTSVAFFVLILACVNFVNLTTARSIRRAKEVGIRKTFGAGKHDLMLQFLGEAFLVTVSGLLIAVVIVEIVMPWYQVLVGEHIPSLTSFSPAEIVGSFLAIVLVAISAGLYPAFHLSRYQPAELHGAGFRSGARTAVRNTLVIFQFAVSTALIICTLLVDTQLRYVLNKDLGFKKENMIVIPLRGTEAQDRAEALKQELSSLPGVINVTASSDVPSSGFTSNGYFPEGHSTPMTIHVVDADERFLDTYGLTVTRGHGFSIDRKTDKTSYLINETLASTLGWDNPIGKTIRRGGDHTVIGVVKDFHYATLHESIEPLIITNQPWRDRYDVLSVHIQTANLSEFLNVLRITWRRVVPSSPFEFSFLDEQVGVLYGAERRFEELFFSFSFLAIVIALLGLLGLASFSTEQRTKEIGIRKVLGASAQGVVALLSRDFARPVAAANLIAWPAAYLFIRRWLEDFAYRTEIPWIMFLLAGGGAFILALVVIGAQSWKAASSNPVKALRYE